MSPECQEQNAKGLTMVAVGVNKAAEQYMILDEQTKEELASGKYRDQRRELFGTPSPSPAPGPALTRQARPRPRSQGVSRTAMRQPWTRSQERLALLYNEQGLRPDEIGHKLGLSTYLVTQIILNKRSRGKL